MASKHDAKKARESFFQMQHNIARHKGQQFWMQKPKQPRIALKAAGKAAATEPAVTEPAVTEPAAAAGEGAVETPAGEPGTQASGKPGP